jgi:hypothetical protein
MDTAEIKERALKAISPIVLVKDITKAEKYFLFRAQRTAASQFLPPYYKVYFLLVELLGFRNLGRFKKVAWSIPIDYNGEYFLIEYRKSGVGIFANDAALQAKEAREIANLVGKGVKCAKPFFKKMAQDAAEKALLNVVNNSNYLFERFDFFLSEYKKTKYEAEKIDEAEKIKDKLIKAHMSDNSWTLGESYYKIKQKPGWLAISAIEAFFSWTEHIFIHIAILNGRIFTYDDVSSLASSDWSEKYKESIHLNEKDDKRFYDDLLLIRKQIRNFITHGAFGKEGEAFCFHSEAGAVPIVMEDKKQNNSFSFSDELAFDHHEAILLIERFIGHLWSGSRKQAKLYIQEYNLPLILAMAADGQYKTAMGSIEKMRDLADYLSDQQQNYWNMDW